MLEPILQENFLAAYVSRKRADTYNAHVHAWDGPFGEDGLDAGGHDSAAVICGGKVVCEDMHQPPEFNA